MCILFRFSDIIQQTWKTYKLTPLYNFIYNVRAFKKYAVQLSAFVQAVSIFRCLSGFIYYSMLMVSEKILENTEKPNVHDQNLHIQIVAAETHQGRWVRRSVTLKTRLANIYAPSLFRKQEKEQWYYQMSKRIKPLSNFSKGSGSTQVIYTCLILKNHSMALGWLFLFFTTTCSVLICDHYFTIA